MIPTQSRTSPWFVPAGLFVLVWAVAFLPQPPALAQTLTNERLSTQDGLSNATVTSITQDQDGFMWFGTWDGLNRYDGYSFKIFKHDPNDAASLSHNWIESIYTDRSGILWIGTFGGGLNRFNPDTGTFTHYRSDRQNPLSLSQDTVTALLEDKNGVLWVGTHRGLNRFDRNTGTFTRFLHDPDDPSSLSNDQVRVIYEDRQGTLWVGTGSVSSTETPIGVGGLNRFHPDTGSFTRYLNDPHDPNSLVDNKVQALFEDSRGRFWVGTLGDGLHMMHRDEGTFTRFPGDPGNPLTISRPIRTGESESTFGFVRFIREDREGFLWIGGAPGGVKRVDPVTGRVSFYESDPSNPSSLSGDWVWSFYESQDGTIWISTLFAGINRINGHTQEIVQISREPDRSNTLSHDYVSQIYEDREEVLWIATMGGGLNRYDPASASFRVFRSGVAENESLSDDNLTYLSGDRKDNLWLGSLNGALDRLDPGSGRIEPFWEGSGNPEKPGSGTITAILEDREGHLWIGRWGGGLNRIDRDGRDVIRYSATTDQPYRVTLLDHVRQLERDRRSLVSIREVRSGQHEKKPFKLDQRTPVLIVAVGELGNESEMWDYGWIENERGDTLWHMEATRTRPAGGSLVNRIQIASAELVPGTYLLNYRTDGGHAFDDWEIAAPAEPGRWGIEIFSIASRSNPLLPADEPVPALSAPLDDFITTLYEDSSGTLWIGTMTTIARFDRQHNSFHSYSLQTPGLPVLGRVSAIRSSKEGGLWIGTTDAGSLHFNPQTATASRIPQGPSQIFGMLDDATGNLWLSTGVGLMRFDPVHRTTSLLPVANTFAFGNHAFKGSSGEFFFGGSRGITAFDPGKIINARPPRTVLTDLRVFNEPLSPSPDGPLKGRIEAAREVRLNHNQNDLTFDFAGLHFRNPERNQYTYMLEPYDTDWIMARNQRSVRYARLKPGTYEFRVRSANSDGVWDEAGTSMRILINPPWWQTVWAYALYGLIFISLLLLGDRILRRRVVHKEQERARDRELIQARELEKAYRALEEAHLHLKTTKTQLVQQEKLASLGQLTAGIAHEIKNPLNFITNFASVTADLAEELREEFKRKGTLHLSDVNLLITDIKMSASKVIEHGQRADGIVRSMLLHSRGTPVGHEEIQLNTLLDEYVNLAYHGMRARVPDFEVQIDRDYDPTVGQVVIIAQEMGRVFLNLLNNAFYVVRERASRSNGTFKPIVKVMTKRTDQEVCVRIEDNGLGIPESIRERIFEPFFTTKPTGQGTGLGLFLAYEIITQGHGGKLNVESKEGEGTVFTITLPSSLKEPEAIHAVVGMKE